MRGRLLASFVFVLGGLPSVATVACDLVPPSREPTIAEQVAGLKVIFGGTVIGYVTGDGARRVGPLPSQCRDDAGYLRYDESLAPRCTDYLDTRAALFRVDVSIVGPAAGEVITYAMHWGDGDCDIDFRIGEKWLVAGNGFTQELRAPIRENEVALLRRLASHPPFDFDQLYR
jgi:hypothetical protein